MALSSSNNPELIRAQEAIWHPIFLDGLRQCANVGYACTLAGIGRTTAYASRDRNPEFRAKWEVAIQEAIDKLEMEAWRRASEGVVREEPIMYQGRQVATKVITEHSDKLMELLLKANRPDKYREQIKVVTATELDQAIDTALQQHQLPGVELSSPIDTTAIVTDAAPSSE